MSTTQQRGLSSTLLFISFSIFVFLTSCNFSLLPGKSDVNASGHSALGLRNLNPDPNGPPWLVVDPNSPSSMARAVAPTPSPTVTQLTFDSATLSRILPSRIDNSATPYFRPIFVQSGGSCGQASGVGYIFTYEIDALRGLDASLPQNQYPTHFTYNFLNGGDYSNSSTALSGWKILKENGVPDVSTYAGMADDAAVRWMSGYDSYEKAMLNRTGDQFTVNLKSSDGIQTLKNWLYDYGNGSSHGGLANFAAGVVTSFNYLPANSPEAGKAVVTAWDTVINHAMTIVGYDDTIGMDFNGDGQFTNNIDINHDGVVDVRDWEKGGFIVANSWGTTWGDQGKVYMMYKVAAEALSQGGIESNTAYVTSVLSTDLPKLTLRAKLSHSGRNRLTVSAGVSQNTASTVPEATQSFTALTNRGGALPLQGDNSNPLEISLDLSPLIVGLDTSKPLKFFLIVSELDSNNAYAGNVQSLSVFNPATQKEWISSQTNVPIANNSTTYVSVNVDSIPAAQAPVVQFSAPQNNSTVSGTLSVVTSVSSSRTVSQWKLLADGNPVASLSSPPSTYSLDTTALTDGAHTLTVTAVDVQGASGSANLNVTVSNQDTTKPTLRVDSPQEGANLSGTVTIRATASDQNGIAKVAFLIDSVRQALVLQPPFVFDWNTVGVANGAHKITVRAFDPAGNATAKNVNVVVTN